MALCKYVITIDLNELLLRRHLFTIGSWKRRLLHFRLRPVK